MGDVLVDARMPDGDDIEAGNFDWRFENDQPPVVLAEQPGRQERDEIVRL